MKTRRMLSVFLCAVLLISCFGLSVVSAAGTTTLSFNLSSVGKTVTDKSSITNTWDLNGSWLQAGSQPTDYYATHDPYVKTVKLMFAMGGNATRDLFVDPNNRNNLTDYKFDNLITACSNVLRQGLKPNINTGNVPLKYSTNPVISGPFGINVSPPDNYDVYYNYIKAIADALKNQFGINEVKTWTWGVTTEYENRDVFDAGDANSTKIAYFKLYDYTVAALEDSLGSENVYVGAHSMTCAAGYWDEKEFLNHCKNGTNYKRGTTGTQLDYVAMSYYDYTPTGFNSSSFLSALNDLRNYANSIGLSGLQFGVGEGRLIAGWDNRDLLTRDVAHCSQGSADAKMFKVLVENDVDWFSQWDGGQSTSWFGGASTVSRHIRNLTYKMTGDQVIVLTKSGSPADSTDEVDGMASYNNATNTVHVLAYNNNANKDATTTETTTITLNNIAPVNGTTVNVKKWIVDETHANWWSTWWQDQANRGLTDGSYFWSKYSSQLPGNLLIQADKDYWNSRLSVYTSLGNLSSTTQDLAVNNNTLTLTNDTAHHGVVFYEITNAKSIPGATGTVVDDLNDWSVACDHSAGLAIDTSNPTLLEDNSRAARNNTNTSPAEYVTYNRNDIVSATVTGLYASSVEPIIDYKFYTSPNGSTWAQITGGISTSDTLINQNNWTRRVYTIGSIPTGTNYLKVEFRTGGSYTWDPELSRVTIQYSGSNIALSATATASSTFTPDYSPAYVINGSTTWPGWASATSEGTDWLELTWAANQTFSRVELYTTSGLCLKDYDLQYWNGSAYQTILQVRNNSNVHVTSTFTAVTTNKLRVNCITGDNQGTSGYKRIDELEVYSSGSAPGQATTPNPSTGATGVSTSPSLSWTTGTGATSHDVYFGTSNPPSFMQNQAGTTYSPSTLAPSTTYYWRIDEKNGNGTTTGTVWNFTTGSSGSIAVSATATASSTFTTDYSPAYVINGSTTWPGWASATSDGTDWLELTWAANQTFSRVELYTTSGMCLKDYDLQYWNGSAYQTILQVRNNSNAHVTSTFTAVTTNKLRVNCITGDNQGTSGFKRIDELEVYNG